MSEYAEDNFSLPELSPRDLVQWLADHPGGWIVDVREPYELPRARLNLAQVTHVPMSELARKHLAALPPSLQDHATPMVIMCHIGQRSAQVTAWLLEQGWSGVLNLSGGIDAYARLVDGSVGFY